MLNDTVHISKQQQRCLFFLSEGMTMKEIGWELNISPRTVEFYLNLVKNKTGLRRRSELIGYFRYSTMEKS